MATTQGIMSLLNQTTTKLVNYCFFELGSDLVTDQYYYSANNIADSNSFTGTYAGLVWLYLPSGAALDNTFLHLASIVGADGDDAVGLKISRVDPSTLKLSTVFGAFDSVDGVVSTVERSGDVLEADLVDGWHCLHFFHNNDGDSMIWFDGIELSMTSTGTSKVSTVFGLNTMLWSGCPAGLKLNTVFATISPAVTLDKMDLIVSSRSKVPAFLGEYGSMFGGQKGSFYFSSVTESPSDLVTRVNLSRSGTFTFTKGYEVIK